MKDVNIDIPARKIQKLSVPSTSSQPESTYTKIEFLTPGVFDSVNDNESEIDVSILATRNNNKENVENQETTPHETETIARVLQCSKNTREEIDYSSTRKSPKMQFKGIYYLFNLFIIIYKICIFN